MSAPARPRIGVLGLGIMGLAYARNLRRAGHEVLGFDIDAGRAAALDAAGGRAMDSARAVAAGADHLILALPTVAALREVIAQIFLALRPGMILAEMGTLPVRAKTDALIAIADTDAILLDCPVSGTGAQAEARDLIVFASGPSEAVAAFRPIFDAIASDTRHVGPFGAGMKMKYVANLLVTIHNIAAAEALILARKSGLDLNVAFDAITRGASSSRMLELRGPMMMAENYDPPTMKMDVHMKDIMLILDHAREVDCPVPLMSASLPWYSAALAQGRGKEDTAALFSVLAGLAGGEPDAG